MLKSLLLLALTALPAQCDTNPVVATDPPPVPPCQGEVVLLQHWDSPLNCDVNPPQMMVIRIDEMNSDFDECHRRGGAIMHDDEIPAWYCLNIDY